MHTCMHILLAQCHIDCIELNAIPFPPDNISWIATCLQSDLAFNWSTVAPNYSQTAIHYSIFASNCGSCPNTTTHTTVTCTDVPTDGNMCTFELQTVVCENVSSDPRRVSVTPRCPNIHKGTFLQTSKTSCMHSFLTYALSLLQ